MMANSYSDPEGKKRMLNHQVFNNTLILDCIFGFSNFDDIKLFRQVCRQWNTLAISFLKKSSLICFRMPDYSLRNFNNLISDSQFLKELTAVKITDTRGADSPFEDHYVVWTKCGFTQLLDAFKTRMTELTIDNVNLEGVTYSGGEFDIGPYVQPSLAKLHITGIEGMTISTDRCVAIKSLNLRECCLKIATGVKITPVELTLEHVQVHLKEDNLGWWLNEFVNFDRLKYLSLDVVLYTLRSRRGICLSLHFRDPATVEIVDLCGSQLNFDFTDAKWKVTKKMSLNHAAFAQRNQMEIANLEFKGAKLDLAVLPNNLERLKIADGNTTNGVAKVICSNPISLPELEFLHLREAKQDPAAGLEMQCISHFNSCKNLTTVVLEFVEPTVNFPCTVDIDTFPKSVRKLYVCGNVEFSGDASSFELKLLQVQKSDPYSLNSILPRFKGKDLAVDLRYKAYSESVFQTVLDIAERPFETIAVSLNHEKESSSFQDSPLSQCTDKLSGFYIFANNFGKAISEQEFEEIFVNFKEMCDN